MRYIANCFLILSCIVLSATICRVQAQPSPGSPPGPPQDSPPPSLISLFFKQPTGQNGYEDLVMAGDLVDRSAAMRGMLAEGATLTVKRRALADLELQRALSLVRAGLDKQIAAPPDDPDPAPRVPGDRSPQLRLLVGLIDLGQLLETEMVVLLADGQTQRAIQTLRDGLRLGYAVRCSRHLVAGRIGIEIDRILICQLARHLDQLSDHDCDSLLPLIREWLDADHSPLPELIDERKHLLEELGRGRKDPARTLQELRNDIDPDNDPQGARLLALANSSELTRASDAAAAMCASQVDAAIANLKLAPWQRQDWKRPEGNTLADFLYGMVWPNLDRSVQRFDEDRARLQLFAVHVALRRYRWQYDRLPDTLDPLRLESLTLDPFTGKPLIYQRHGDDYELSSVGPSATDDDGVRLPGKHTPIVLPR